MHDALSRPSQLLLRNRERLAADSLLLINPPPDGVYRLLPGAAALSLDWGACRALATQGGAPRFGLGAPAEEEPRSFVRVVVFLTKAKARTRMLLDYAASVCRAGGSVWLVGEKRAGIASAGKLLAAVGATTKLDAARHCMLFAAHAVDPRPGPFSLENYWQVQQVSAGGLELRLASLPGVFSHGELDPGTRMLLDHLTFDGRPGALDYGCGCGVVAAFLARRGARVTAVDSDALALEASARTLALNGIDDAVVAAADRLAEVPGRFDLIVSNPPFHAGTLTATATAHALIREAPEHLRPGGRLILVANAFLDYPRVLSTAFGACRVLAQDNRYRVYEARA